MPPSTGRATLTEGAVAPMMIRLAIPMLIGILAVVAFNLVDTWFVSRLGTAELAAISFTFPVVLLVNSLAMGLGQGTVSVLSRAFGQGDSHRAEEITTDSLILAVAVTAVLCLSGLLTIKPLFRALGASEELLPLIVQYMKWWYLGMPFVIIPMVGNYAIRATGDTRTPGMIMVVAVLVNCALDPLLIFGLGWVPAMGLAGAAIATVMARAFTMCLSLSILHFREHLLCLERPSWARFAGSCRQVLYVGLPAAGIQILGPVTMGVLTRLVSAHGTEAVAATGIGTRVEAIALLPMLSLSTVVIPFVGQNWGAKRYDRVREGQQLGSRFSLGWGLACWALLGITAPLMVRLFSDELAVRQTAEIYLWIVPVGYGAWGVQMVVSNVYNAVNRPLLATGLSGLRLGTLCLLAWLGSMWWGLPGLFAGVALGNLIGGGGSGLLRLRVPVTDEA